MAKILVTGAAGFIGSHVSHLLLKKGHQVVGLDNMNDYYDVNLKKARLAELEPKTGFSFIKLDLANKEGIEALFKAEKFDIVINLAAQAGVRYSLINPHAYIDSNIVGFLNILEGVRHNDVKHLIYASSSSVYGANTEMPFSTDQAVDHPVSLYAASKRSNELMAHTYSHIFGMKTTGLRFFTVYGPWGRPDMALYLFADAIHNDRPIDVFNYGKMLRDFTYVDDIVAGVTGLVDYEPKAVPDAKVEDLGPSRSTCPFQVYNIGHNDPVELERMIQVMEDAMGKKAERNYMPLQDGDVPKTYANIDALSNDIGFKPTTPIEVGIPKFVEWYRGYHGIS